MPPFRLLDAGSLLAREESVKRGIQRRPGVSVPGLRSRSHPPNCRPRTPVPRASDHLSSSSQSPPARWRRPSTARHYSSRIPSSRTIGVPNYRAEGYPKRIQNSIPARDTTNRGCGATLLGTRTTGHSPGPRRPYMGSKPRYRISVAKRISLLLEALEQLSFPIFQPPPLAGIIRLYIRLAARSPLFTACAKPASSYSEVHPPSALDKVREHPAMDEPMERCPFPSSSTGRRLHYATARFKYHTVELKSKSNHSPRPKKLGDDEGRFNPRSSQFTHGNRTSSVPHHGHHGRNPTGTTEAIRRAARPAKR